MKGNEMKKFNVCFVLFCNTKHQKIKLVKSFELFLNMKVQEFNGRKVKYQNKPNLLLQTNPSENFSKFSSIVMKFIIQTQLRILINSIIIQIFR